MPTFFMPWHKVFYEIRRQPGQKEWLRSALFNDRGALVDEIPAVPPKKQNPSASPVLRLRRETESFNDLRGTHATGASPEGHQQWDHWNFDPSGSVRTLYRAQKKH